MQPHTTSTYRRTPRRLTILIESRYGYHERLDLLVNPGVTAAQLPLDDSHSTLVLPGGEVLTRTADLFQVAGDTPKLFAFYEPARAPELLPPRHHPSLARLLHRGGHPISALLALPGPRHGTAP